MFIVVVFVIKLSFLLEVILSLVGFFFVIFVGFFYIIIRYLYGKVKVEINVFYFFLLFVICIFLLMMLNFIKFNLFEIFMFIVGIGVFVVMG